MSILIFGVFIVLAGILSISLDGGILLTTKRQLQGAVDLAALKASTDLDNNAAIVAEVLNSNGFHGDLTASSTVTLGTFPPTGYTMDTVEGLPINDRFQVGGASPNSLRVTAQTTPHLYLSHLFYHEPISVSATAVAGNFPVTQVAVRTTALAFDSSKSQIFNAVLSSFWGSSINLSAASYDGLVSGNIRLLPFLDALGTSLGLTTGSYDAVLQQQVTLPEVLQAATTAISADPSFSGDPAAVTATLASLSGVGAGLPFTLSDFITLDAENPQSAAAAYVNLFDLIEGSSQAANKQKGVVNTVSIPLAGGQANISVAIIDPMQISAIGGVGVHAETAQARFLIEFIPTQLLSLPPLNLSVRLPLLFELSKGSATVTGISCPTPNAADGKVDVSAQSTPASISFADVDPNTLGQSGPLTTSPGTIVSDPPLLQVTATGQTTYLGQHSDLEFSAPFDYSNFQSVDTATPISSAGSSLIDSLSFNVSIAGLPLITTSTVLSALTPILTAVEPTLDSLIDNLTEALGVRAGEMEAGVPFLKCSNPLLIQ